MRLPRQIGVRLWSHVRHEKHCYESCKGQYEIPLFVLLSYCFKIDRDLISSYSTYYLPLGNTQNYLCPHLLFCTVRLYLVDSILFAEHLQSAWLSSGAGGIAVKKGKISMLTSILNVWGGKAINKGVHIGHVMWRKILWIKLELGQTEWWSPSS